MTHQVVIVGGGIVGAACAYYLSLSGLHVRLLERDFAASGTSRACDGLILHFDKLSPAELALAHESAGLWAGLAETLEADFEYRRRGALVLSETPEGLSADSRSALSLAATGVRAETLDCDSLRRLEPNLAPDLAGGVYYPDEAHLDARLATLALLDAAQRYGAVLENGAEVTGMQRNALGHVVSVTTRDGEIPADAVVLAAGVWSGEIARSVGVQLPIRPRKGHILVTARVPGLIRHPMLEGSYTASVESSTESMQAALVAEMTGGDTLLLGSTREFAGMDRMVAVEAMQAIATRAIRYLPCLARTSIIRSYAGLRPWSPDHLPLIGPISAVPGLYLATGHEGAGIGLAPITGQIIAGWITAGSEPSLAGPVRPDRFASLIQEN